jgi:hypothetical protein
VIHNDTYHYWEAKRYEVRQIVLTDKYQAVYAEREDNEGSYHLKAYTIHALGVALVTTKHFKRPKDATGRPTLEDEHSDWEIVGLELLEGYFDVVNECSNFAGLLAEGQDIHSAIGELDYDLCKQLAGSDKEPAGE